MSFKLPNYPSPQPHIHELADFAELIAWIHGKCSARDIQSFLGQIDDNDYNVGIEDNDVNNENLSDEMMQEIGLRTNACTVAYPFHMDKAGSVLEYLYDSNIPSAAVYLFLLLATRLNMQNEKVQQGVDGTVLMEELSTEVLRSYLGHDRAFSLGFGTAVRGRFCDKVQELCKSIGEGGVFRHIDSGSVDANDDCLDVVGWIPFLDNMPSKLSVFGQCKTGTSWDNIKTELQPSDFIKRWMSRPFIFDPIRAFFIAEAADRAHWSGTALYTGILFDRCRIVDFSNHISSTLLARIQQWNEAVKSTLISASWGRLTGPDPIKAEGISLGDGVVAGPIDFVAFVSPPPSFEK